MSRAVHPHLDGMAPPCRRVFVVKAVAVGWNEEQLGHALAEQAAKRVA